MFGRLLLLHLRQTLICFIFNNSLKAYIHVKFQSINETAGHAALSCESTAAVLRLSEVLANAVPVGNLPRKYNDKNQKPYSKMLLMRWGKFSHKPLRVSFLLPTFVKK